MKLANEISKTFSFTVPVADLEIAGLNKDNYVSGETAFSRIQNTGGVDGQWSYVLRLYNSEELPVYEKRGETPQLQAGLGYQDIYFDLSNQLRSGNYRLELNGINTATQKLSFDYRRFILQGLDVNVSIDTDKQIYKTSENIQLNANINTSGTLQDAKAIFKIYSAAPGWTNYMHNKRVYSSAVDPDGKTVWFATDGGLISFDTVTVNWHQYTTAEGCPYNDLRAVAVDNEWVYLVGESTRPYANFSFGRYNKLTHQSETIMEIGSAGEQIILINTGDSVWMRTDDASWGGWVSRYDKATGQLKSYGYYYDLKYDGADLWLTYANKVYKYNKLTDTIEEKFDVGVPLVRIAADEQYIWGYVSDTTPTDFIWVTDIYRINKLTGQKERVKQNLSLGGWSYGYIWRPGLMYSDEDRLYICNPAGRGLVWYDKSTGADGDYASVGVGGVLSLSSDKNNLWVGTYGGISRYEKGYNWQSFTQSGGLATNSARSVAVDDKYLWVNTVSQYTWNNQPAGTSHTMNRYDFLNNTWKQFGISASCMLPLGNKIWIGSDKLREFDYQSEAVSEVPLPASISVSDMKKDGNDIWLGGGSKLLRYDTATSSWTAYNFPDINSAIVKIFPDGKYVWAICIKGWNYYDRALYRFDRETLNWVLVRDNITAVDLYVDEENVWFYNDRTLVKYNKSSGITTNIGGFFRLGSVGYYWTMSVGCIIPDGNYLWVGGNGGVVRYNKETGEREIFTMSDGLAGNNIVYGAFDDDSVWFAIDDNRLEGEFPQQELSVTGGGGVSRYLKKGKVFYSKTVDNVSGNGIIPLSVTADVISYQGKYYADVTIKNKEGQKLATAEKGFFVNDGAAVLTFETDKRAYRPGEIINVSGRVFNYGLTELTTSVAMLKGNEEIFSQAFTIPAGGFESFNFQMPAFRII